MPETISSSVWRFGFPLLSFALIMLLRVVAVALLIAVIAAVVRELVFHVVGVGVGVRCHRLLREIAICVVGVVHRSARARHGLEFVCRVVGHGDLLGVYLLVEHISDGIVRIGFAIAVALCKRRELTQLVVNIGGLDRLPALRARFACHADVEVVEIIT